MSDYDTIVEVDVERLEPEVIIDQSDPSVPYINESGDDAGLKCQYCGKLYKSASSLQAHFNLKHPKDQIIATCTACDKTYPSLLSLQKHVHYKHRSKYNCKVCYKSFANESLLEYHESWCKAEDTPCAVCGKIFSSGLSMRNHMKYKHPEEYYRYRCGVCRRSFSSSRGLSNHMGCLHGYSVRCPLCDRLCCSSTTLQTHIISWHTESDYNSPRQVRRRQSLNDDEEKRTYACGVCKEVYDRTKLVIDHIMEKHVKNKSDYKNNKRRIKRD